jgi:hypothetical protein
MTTGEYLLLNSTLPSGTALEHLLALQIGVGGGTIIANSLVIVSEHPQTYCTSKAPDHRVTAEEPVRGADTESGVYAVFNIPKLSIFIATERLYITTSSTRGEFCLKKKGSSDVLINH